MVVLSNNKECKALKKFQSAVSDLHFDDGTLLRFLRARNLDTKKAEVMLRASIEWRKENDVDSFQFYEIPREIEEGFDVYQTGYDDEGRPVYYAPLGMWCSARDLFAKGMEDDCLRFAAKYMDMVHRLLLQTKHQNFVCIVDNTGVTMRKAMYEIQNLAGIQALIRIFHDYEANFPETLYKAFVINTPSVFYWGYNIVKPLMAANTIAKINFFDTTEEIWKPKIHENIPLDAIPEKYGGTAQLTPLF